MSGGYGIAGHKNSYTRARIENWAEDWRGQELMERRGTTFTRFDAKTEATSRFSHPAREPARDLGPQPAPRTDADPRAGQAPHILLAHGKFAHDPKADDPARFASMSHTMHAAAVAATPLTSTDVIAEPDRRKPGVEAALIAGNRLGLTASREKSLVVGEDPRDPHGARGTKARPTPATAGTTAFTSTSRLATKAVDTELRVTAARAIRAAEAAGPAGAATAAASGDAGGVEVITIPDGLGGTVTRIVGRRIVRKPGFSASFSAGGGTQLMRK